ncbi:hypothetical protein R6Q59_025001 [Mikania micrantha]
MCLFKMQQNPNTQWQQPNPQTGFSSFSQPGFQPVFSSFTQPGCQQRASQLRHEPDFVSNDVVLETQESQKSKKKGKRAKDTETGRSSGPMAPKPWTHVEETALERCHIDHSKNKTKGNSQKRENFWKKLTETWHEMMGYTDQEYRTYHQLCSKWKVSAKLMQSSGIYINYANNRKSGMNDEDAPKFHVLCQETNKDQCSSRRTKNFETHEYSPGGSDAHTVNLKQEDEDDKFEIQEPVRPVGWDTAKQASSSSRQTSSSIPTTNELAHQLEEFMRFQKTKYEYRLLRADLKVMGTMPFEELGDEEREIMRKLRSKIFDRYR